MPQLARRYPLTRREPVTETPCDRTFDAALKSHETAWKKVRAASATCLYSVARQLFTASQHFDASDTELRTFRGELTRGLADRDFIVVGRAVRQFLAGIDRTKIDFSDESSAEASLVHAIVNYQDALEAWSRDDHNPPTSSPSCAVRASTD